MKGWLISSGPGNRDGDSTPASGMPIFPGLPQSEVVNPHPGEFAEFGVEGQNLTVCPIACGLCEGDIHKAEAGPVLSGKAIHRFEERI